ncbi:uncharacterized protein [Amphiura filiformis]|uniref:uncharacterized protein n=1 Tax=Amphiura filiformis TaxID=82378 RepID=UPI003B218703
MVPLNNDESLDNAPNIEHEQQIPVLLSARREKTSKPRSVEKSNLRDVQPSGSFLDVRVWNATSVGNKTNYICDYVLEGDVDILFLVETWLFSEEYAVIQELKPMGYSFLNFSRGSKTRGGGIGILYKSTLNLTITVTEWDTKLFEHCCVTDLQSGLRFICIYRPPPSVVNKYRTSDFINEFDNFINDVTTMPNKLLILGDFNIHVNIPTKSEVRNFQNSLSTAGFQQHISCPTHESGNTLDLLISRADDNIVVNYSVKESLLSKHHFVKCTLRYKKPSPKKVTSTRRDFRTLDDQAFRQDLDKALNDIPDSVDHVNDLVCYFSKSCAVTLDQHAPFKTKSRSTRGTPPWFNEDIFSERRLRRQLERKWRKSMHEEDCANYRNQLHIVNTMIAQAKTSIFKTKVVDANAKDLFRTISNLLNGSTKPLLFMILPKHCVTSSHFSSRKKLTKSRMSWRKLVLPLS